MRWIIIVALLLAASTGWAQSQWYCGNPNSDKTAYTGFAPDTYRVATEPGDVECNQNLYDDWIYQDAKLIEIKAQEGGQLGGPGDLVPGDWYTECVLFDPIGRTNNGESLNGTYNQTPDKSLWKPRIFARKTSIYPNLTGRDCFNWNYVDYNDESSFVHYDIAGYGNSGGGYYFGNRELREGGNGQIYYREAGPLGTDFVMIPFISNPADDRLRFGKPDGRAVPLYYRAAGADTYLRVVAPFFTEKPTAFESAVSDEILSVVGQNAMASLGPAAGSFEAGSRGAAILAGLR